MTGITLREWRLWIALAAAMATIAAARAAEPAIPFELRAEGSFPLQYVETVTGASRQHTLTAAPYLGLTATARLQPDLITSVFAEGGHSQLGSFRDNDDTFASVGANLVKRWGALSAGVAVEHSQFYDGVFGKTTNIVNDINFFARYLLRPNPDVKIIPAARVTIRLDDALAVERYLYSVRFDVERRLFGPWWAVAATRVRYSEYVGSETGRHDTRLAIVGGLKYEFNDSVGARMLAGFENRSSNVRSNSDKFSIGASIDFNIDLLRPGAGIGR